MAVWLFNHAFYTSKYVFFITHAFLQFGSLGSNSRLNEANDLPLKAIPQKTATPDQGKRTREKQVQIHIFRNVFVLTVMILYTNNINSVDTWHSSHYVPHIILSIFCSLCIELILVWLLIGWHMFYYNGVRKSIMFCGFVNCLEYIDYRSLFILNPQKRGFDYD